MASPFPDWNVVARMVARMKEFEKEQAAQARQAQALQTVKMKRTARRPRGAQPQAVTK